MRRAIGIDLGTTNSCVAALREDGVARILANHQGETRTPSMVSVVEKSNGSRRTLTGAPAMLRAITHPADTVVAAKRLLGRRYDDPEVQRLAPTLPCPVVTAANGDAWVTLAGEAVSPQQICAFVLAELRGVAEQFFSGAVGEAVITVPAHFGHRQRQAILDAAEMAGFTVRRLLSEPAAAAIGYGAHRGANRRFAVCDLGGGTFDVAIVNAENGVLEVISTHADPFLGGEDFDRAIVEHLVADLGERHEVDVLADVQAAQRLKGEAQLAKHLLSGAREATIRLPNLVRLPGGAALDYEYVLRRETLEAITRPLVHRLVAPCREATSRCGLEPQEIDAVIAVGGMTRMAAVQWQLAAVFGRPPLKVVNPDELVALGAAIHCALLDGLVDGAVLLDVTSRALGIALPGGPYQPLIPRNATIPTREHRIIATTEPGQRELVFDVYEGEPTDPGGNCHLGRFTVANLPDAPGGEVLVLVDMTVDVDGVVRVAAAELGSGQPAKLRLAAAGLTRQEVRAMGERMRQLS